MERDRNATRLSDLRLRYASSISHRSRQSEEDYEICDLTMTRGRSFANQEAPQFQLSKTTTISGSKSGMSKIRVIE